MLISEEAPEQAVGAASVRFEGAQLIVGLTDGREVSIDFMTTPWLSFLRDASPAERANWTLEPGGFAVFWPGLDDGVEVCHLLGLAPVA